jgi:hypothetical protein
LESFARLEMSAAPFTAPVDSEAGFANWYRRSYFDAMQRQVATTSAKVPRKTGK